ncbi:MAG: hypothetical protein FJ316_08430 [SAR202 cluster bacterium]|nr:hypothetical protein [SAR202 cluster bacterium]
MPGQPPPYTESELALVRAAIGRLRFLPHIQSQAIAGAVAAGHCPEVLAPLWPLATTHAGLFRQLVQDPLLVKYGIYALFPSVYPKLLHSNSPPRFTMTGRARGAVAIFQWGQRGLVVKPLQSSREGDIARLASVLEVGPRQFPSLPGFLTEEFTQGQFFTGLPPAELTESRLYGLGLDLGQKLARLHSHRICYNDATISDPAGRSHWLVCNGSTRLIDFGISLLLDRHPELSLEDTYNFIRTQPLFRMLSGMAGGNAGLGPFLAEYRHRLSRTPLRELLERDRQYAEQGVQLASRHMGKDLEGPFLRGFRQSYG